MPTCQYISCVVDRGAFELRAIGQRAADGIGNLPGTKRPVTHSPSPNARSGQADRASAVAALVDVKFFDVDRDVDFITA